MVEIFGTTFYTLWMATILFAILSPFVILVTLKIIRRIYRDREQQPSVAKKLVVVSSCIFSLFVALHWDIFLVGQQAKKLCREQGLHIYKTVEAEGFFYFCCAEEWLDYGFSYVEVDKSKEKFRYSREDGKLQRKKIDNYISQYEVMPTEVTIVMEFFGRSRLSRIRDSVRDKRSGEILGDYTYFVIYPSWLDRFVAFEFTGWSCGKTSSTDASFDDLNSILLIKETIKPIVKQ